MLAERLDEVSFLAPVSQGLALAIVVLAITLLTLVLGELAPKRLALSRPESYAMAFARPMRISFAAHAPGCAHVGLVERVGAAPVPGTCDRG